MKKQANTSTKSTSKAVAKPFKKPMGRPIINAGVDIAVVQRELVYRINEQIAREGLNARQFADAHDLQYSMLVSVLNNTRWVARGDKEAVIKPLARVLNVPPVTILIYAGALDFMDFALEETLEDRLDKSYKVMASDPAVNAFLPPESIFRNWDKATKTAFVMLYQVASNKVLLDMTTIEVPDLPLTTSHGPNTYSVEALNQRIYKTSPQVKAQVEAEPTEANTYDGSLRMKDRAKAQQDEFKKSRDKTSVTKPVAKKAGSASEALNDFFGKAK